MSRAFFVAASKSFQRMLEQVAVHTVLLGMTIHSKGDISYQLLLLSMQTTFPFSNA